LAAVDDYERVHPENAGAWRAWLAEHHDSSPGVWLVSWKKASGREPVPMGDLIDEALCFGWIDSLARRLDEDRMMRVFSPRKPTSRWSRINKDKVARLTAEGRMAPSGLALVEEAKRSGTWTALDDVENLVVPDDLANALDGRPGARATWEAYPPSVRRAVLAWILDAKRPATREKRLAEIAEDAGAGERPRQWRG
jgi:uncharacterized protein YdeI (YjbR/CyaY-like superfamily)